jgi:hypothetical protein
MPSCRYWTLDGGRRRQRMASRVLGRGMSPRSTFQYLKHPVGIQMVLQLSTMVIIGITDHDYDEHLVVGVKMKHWIMYLVRRADDGRKVKLVTK